MSKKMNLAELLAAKQMTKADKARGTFKAPALTCTVTGPDGEVIFQGELEARAFSPKENPEGGAQGGCGWYANIVRGQANFKGLPLSGGLRFSVAGLKIAAGDTVDLTGSDE